MALLLGVTWLLGVADPRTQKLAAVGVAATHLAFFSTTVYLLVGDVTGNNSLLSTTFLGLLAILLLYGYRRKDVSRGDHAQHIAAMADAPQHLSAINSSNSIRH